MVAGPDTLCSTKSRHFSGVVGGTANSTCIAASSLVVMGDGEQCERLVKVTGRDVGGVQLGEDVLAGNEDDPVACDCCSCQPIGRQVASDKP